MIITVTLNPAVDKTAVIEGFRAGKVNRMENVRRDPGGKGVNVSKALNALCARSVAMGIAGGNNGEYILRCLRDEGIETEFVMTREETRANLKIVDPLSGMNTDINEPGAPVSAQELEELRQRLMKRIAPGDIVVLAGKTPPKSSDALLFEWARDCAGKGARVFLDAEGEPLRRGVAAAPFLIKPNLEELERLMGRGLPDEEDVAKAMRELRGAGVEYVAVSLGEKGALFCGPKGIVRGYGLTVPVRSTVGAGDSMVAALAYGFQRGDSWEETAARALAVSAAKVMRSGSQPARMSDAEELRSRVRLTEYAAADRGVVGSE